MPPSSVLMVPEEMVRFFLAPPLWPQLTGPKVDTQPKLNQPETFY